MGDQLLEHVKRMQAEGVPEADIIAFVQKFDSPEEPTPQAQPERPTSLSLRDGSVKDRLAQWDKENPRPMTWRENAPSIGSALASLATGGVGLIPSAIATGGGAYLGARLAGESREDASARGVMDAGAALVVPGVVRGVLRAGPAIADKGRDVARSYLKPTLDAGRKESVRLFGRPAMASHANEAVVDRGLQRGVLGADNPEMAVSDAIDATENQLKKLVGDQPTRLNDMLGAVFQRGRNAARNAPKDVPAAQAAIESEIARTRTGNLGGKLDYGSPRPDAPSDAVSAQSLVQAMRGKQPSAGNPRPTPPRLVTALERVQNQQPKTQIMRDAPEGSELAGVIGRNYSDPILPNTTPLIASHRPPNITAREALDWARAAAKDSSWDKPSSGLVGWFNKAQESAARSAVKDAVPEARPLLNELGDLISLQRVIPQATNREANRNTVARLPGMLAALMAGHPVKAGAALLGTNMADQNAGKIAQTLYNTGKRLPSASPESAKAASQMIQAALVAMLEAKQ